MIVSKIEEASGLLDPTQLQANPNCFWMDYTKPNPKRYPNSNERVIILFPANHTILTSHHYVPILSLTPQCCSSYQCYESSSLLPSFTTIRSSFLLLFSVSAFPFSSFLFFFFPLFFLLFPLYFVSSIFFFFFFLFFFCFPLSTSLSLLYASRFFIFSLMCFWIFCFLFFITLVILLFCFFFLLCSNQPLFFLFNSTAPNGNNWTSLFKII